MHARNVRQKNPTEQNTGNNRGLSPGHVLSKFTKNTIHLLYFMHQGQQFCVKMHPRTTEAIKIPTLPLSPRIALISA